MKLYLSSYRIPTPDDLHKLIGKHPNSARIALVPNAKDYFAERARTVKIKDTISDLRGLGLKAEVIDLNSLSEKQVVQVLSGFDAVFIAGGNTFCLRWAMRRSGFDKVIKGLVENGLVYIGESAGAVTAGKTLKGTELADNPEFAEKVIWQGLGLISKIILPHADNLQFAEATQAAALMHKDDPDLIKLNDNQALIVTGKTSRVVTGSAK